MKIPSAFCACMLMALAVLSVTACSKRSYSPSDDYMSAQAVFLARVQEGFDGVVVEEVFKTTLELSARLRQGNKVRMPNFDPAEFGGHNRAIYILYGYPWGVKSGPFILRTVYPVTNDGRIMYYNFGLEEYRLLVGSIAGNGGGR